VQPALKDTELHGKQVTVRHMPYGITIFTVLFDTRHR